MFYSNAKSSLNTNSTSSLHILISSSLHDLSHSSLTLSVFPSYTRTTLPLSVFSFHRRPCWELSHSAVWSQTPDSCSAPHDRAIQQNICFLHEHEGKSSLKSPLLFYCALKSASGANASREHQTPWRTKGQSLRQGSVSSADLLGSWENMFCWSNRAEARDFVCLVFFSNLHKIKLFQTLAQHRLSDWWSAWTAAQRSKVKKLCWATGCFDWGQALCQSADEQVRKKTTANNQINRQSIKTQANKSRHTKTNRFTWKREQEGTFMHIADGTKHFSREQKQYL